MKFFVYLSIKTGIRYTWRHLAEAYRYSYGRYPHNEDLLMKIVEKIQSGLYQEVEVSEKEYFEIDRALPQ